MSHQNIAHRWAQMNSGLSAKGYAMFAEGLSIFSWGRHFEIARWTETTATEAERKAHNIPAMCVLFNDDSYSSSTGKHKSYTRRAIRGSAEVFTIPHALWLTPAALQWYEAEARESYAKAERARVYSASHIEQAERTLREAARYALAFRFKWSAPASVQELQDRLQERVRKQQAAERKAHREQAKAQERLHAEQRIAFEAWQRGEGYSVPSTWRVDSNGAAYVRRQGEELQTSMGATVPWEHAVKAFRFITMCRAKGEAWHRNGRTVRVGHYQLDSIDAQGNMHAGCHYFAWSHMEALARREGVKIEASSEAVETTHS